MYNYILAYFKKEKNKNSKQSSIGKKKKIKESYEICLIFK